MVKQPQLYIILKALAVCSVKQCSFGHKKVCDYTPNNICIELWEMEFKGTYFDAKYFFENIYTRGLQKLIKNCMDFGGLLFCLFIWLYDRLSFLVLFSTSFLNSRPKSILASAGIVQSSAALILHACLTVCNLDCLD